VKKSLQELVFHPAVKNMLPVEALAAMYHHMKNFPKTSLKTHWFKTPSGSIAFKHAKGMRS